MMNVKNLVNQKVMHKVYGEGVIFSADEKHLEVQFTMANKRSKFVYPACFNGFLSLKNEELRAEMETIVELWKVESGVVEKEKIRHQYEKTIHGIEKRRIAAEKKKTLEAKKSLEHRTSYNVRMKKKIV